MSTWVGVPPGMPVTVATPPAPGVSVGPGPVAAVVVPESWMHIVPDFSAARFTAAVTLTAALGVEALPEFAGDVVLGATITTISELVAAATTAATATGHIAIPIPARAACAGTLGAVTSTAADALFAADGALAAAMHAAGLIPADFGTVGTLHAEVDKAGFAARFTAGATLSALVAQGDRANASYATTGTLAAQVLVLFVRTATYAAAAQLAATQAVEPRDGGTVGASLTAATRAVAITTAAHTATATLAATVSGKVNWTDTRADKTANQPIDRAVWTPITWNTSTGDPIVGNAIVISGAGQATIAATVNHSISGNRDIRATVNGVQVAIVSSALSTTATSIPATSVTLNPGDQVRLEANPDSFAAANRAVNAGTFMTITAAP